MPRIGTRARQRKRAGLPPVKPGKVGWVHGSKLAFFEDGKEPYLAAAELKETGPFYDQMAQRYLSKYGYNTPWDGDLEDDQDIADDVDPKEDVDKLPTAVVEFRAEYFHKLRAVRVRLAKEPCRADAYQKIGVWYNAQYGGSVEKRGKKVTFRQLFDKPALEPPAPVKPRVLHYYSRRFYNQRVKPLVTARWAAVSLLPNPPFPINVRKDVTKEAWAAETAEFKAEVIEAIEMEHTVAKEAYETVVSGETPSTPEGYNVALNNAGYYLQPFADAMHERYGMNVAILMCGPVPERGGRIEVRSVHAGMTNGLVPRSWSDFDRGGFDAAQRSMVEFTHHCFTEAECKARSLKKTAPEETGGEETGGAAAEDTGGDGDMGDVPEVPTTQDLIGATAQDVLVKDGAPQTISHTIVPSVPSVPSSGLQQILHDPDLLSFDLELLRDPLLEDEDLMSQNDERSVLEDFYTGFEELPRLNLENRTAPAEDAPPRPPAVGCALLGELDDLPEAERAWMMEKLKGMSEEEVEQENELARGRRVLRHIDEGMSAVEALAMSSDAEDDEDRAAEGKKAGGKAKRGKRAAGSAGDASSPVARLAPAPPPAPPRPMPCPMPRRILQRPEDNRAAEGPLGDPGNADAALQRPEYNREAEGPLGPPPTAVAMRPGRFSQGGGTVLVQAGRENVGGWGVEASNDWPAELANAVGGFARGQSWGGEEWQQCVMRVIDLERTWGFPAKGLLSMPAGGDKERPVEIPTFMRLARKWGTPVQLTSAVGPRDVEGSYAYRWWGWWERVQPGGRATAEGGWKDVEDVDEAEWDDLAKMHGRNGMLLVVGALLWWGEACAEEEDSDRDRMFADWRLAVKDVAGALEAALKRVPSVKKAVELTGKQAAVKPKKTAPAPSASKAKRKNTASAEEKENDAPAK
ncbi:hypothetical protein B0H11DRAFT_1942046 [Mycena galericulata]|nr:hypothetical protein B0H11DRAFT_1942046 [Mycena galericulata]